MACLCFPSLLFHGNAKGASVVILAGSCWDFLGKYRELKLLRLVPCKLECACKKADQ